MDMKGQWRKTLRVSVVCRPWTASPHYHISKLRLLVSPDQIKALFPESLEILKCVCKKCVYITEAICRNNTIIG